MKRITGLTEEMAQAVAAMVVTFRAVRSAHVVRDRNAAQQAYSFVVEVQTYSAEEDTGAGIGASIARAWVEAGGRLPQIDRELNENLTSRGSGKDCGAGAQ